MTSTLKAKPIAPSPMQTGSSVSVRVFWLDRTEAIKRLQTAIQALVEQHPEIERVILFGSLARGDAVPGSDADLLLVLTDSPLPFLARCAFYRPSDAGLAVDVFAYTRLELDAMLAAGNPFIAQATREGVVLDISRRQRTGEIDTVEQSGGCVCDAGRYQPDGTPAGWRSQVMYKRG